jgi:S-adenosylmethionine hydrolase
MDQFGLKTITVITDCTDVAFAEIWCALSLELRRTGCSGFEIAPIVPVQPLSVLNACFLLRLLAESVPSGSVLYSVVNPIQMEAPRVIGKTSRRDLIFVGRDTGQFSWLTADLGCESIVEFESPFVPFGGRSIYPAIIAEVLSGRPLDNIGKARRPPECQRLTIEQGTIVHVDNFGLMKIKQEPGWDELIQIGLGSKVLIVTASGEELIATYGNRMMSFSDGEWVLYKGSSLFGMPELGLVRQNGASILGCKIGDKISIERTR